MRVTHTRMEFLETSIITTSFTALPIGASVNWLYESDREWHKRYIIHKNGILASESYPQGSHSSHTLGTVSFSLWNVSGFPLGAFGPKKKKIFPAPFSACLKTGNGF